MEKLIYLDNAATTLRKPPGVAEAVAQAILTAGNAARGAHGASMQASRTVYETRQKLARLLGCPRPDHVVFTSNSTTALNICDWDSAEVSDVLYADYGIATRPGAHCAPRLHEALGTVRQGAVRFSFSVFNSEDEADMAIQAVKELAQSKSGKGIPGRGCLFPTPAAPAPSQQRGRGCRVFPAEYPDTKAFPGTAAARRRYTGPEIDRSNRRRAQAGGHPQPRLRRG